jgi:glucokinase
MADYQHDSRIVLTLDAGGTSFRFGARQGGAFVTETIVLPTNGDNLKLCLGNIVQGFKQVLALCPAKPVAISFAFPGPADYSRGIIGDLPNLPAFRGGIALGDMLQEKFHLPVFINNDGDLFAYGEAIAGFLPYVNGLLEKAGSPKRYKNLIGMTLGTGLGGGLARAGELFDGDNSVAAQFHLFRHKFNSQMSAEEGACIRAVRRTFAELAGIPLAKTPDPRVIADIAAGRAPGHQAAAIRAYQQLGLVAGDALANALAMVDGLAVIGGGISQAWPLFLPALVDELNGTFVSPEKV